MAYEDPSTGPTGVTGTEQSESPTITDGRSGELLWLIRGSADQDDIIAEIEALAPATFKGLDLSSVEARPLYVAEEDPAGCIWEGKATYTAFQVPTQPVVGDSFRTFDTGGGMQHITQSLETIVATGTPVGSAPTGFGAINFDGEQVHGTDIVAPAFAFSERVYKDSDDVTTAYQLTVASLTGRTNASSFKGHAAGTVLFMGGSGQQRGEEDWELTFLFQVQSTLTGLTFGDITNVPKNGWEFVWVRFEDGVSNKLKIRKPKAAYVERVYEPGNFALLDIGT